MACWLQDVVLIALIGRYSGVEDWRMLCGAALFGLLCWWLLSSGCNIATLKCGCRCPHLLCAQQARPGLS